MTRELLRSFFGYAVAISLLTFYGGRVCPLIDSLGLAKLAAILAGCFATGVGLKAAALAAFLPHDPARARLSPWTFFAVDLVIWLAVAASFTAFDRLAYGFPVTSGLKMTVGVLALGFYASAYEALRHERELIELAAKRSLDRIAAGPPLNTAQRFFWFTAASLVLLSGVLLLLLYKDLVMEQIPVLENGAAPKSWFLAIFKEVLFVLGVLIAGTIACTRKYASNVRRMFELEQMALDAVKAGRFDVRVPVVSRDEFSEIADGTNGMIEGLAEKEKYRSILGMVVSPTVAKRILAREAMLGGDTVDATVLFADLRDYTTISEKVSPDQMVTLLNEYFTMVNRVIEKNGGFVNKFIGDAVMAIFGLDEPNGACEAALRAALEIRVELLVLNKRLAERGLPMIENGIGIHHGPCIAGVIGAKERVEFTLIGDTVNTASRLESLTKSLSSFVAASKAVYERVTESMRQQMEPAGEHLLKGKAEKFAVYGLSEATRPSRW